MQLCHGVVATDTTLAAVAEYATPLPLAADAGVTNSAHIPKHAQDLLGTNNRCEISEIQRNFDQPGSTFNKTNTTNNHTKHAGKQRMLTAFDQ